MVSAHEAAFGNKDNGVVPCSFVEQGSFTKEIEAESS